MDLRDVTINPVHIPMFGFARGSGDADRFNHIAGSRRRKDERKIVMIEFVIVDYPGHFNAVLGRPFLFKVKGVISMFYLSMKFPVKDDIGRITGDRATTRKFYAKSVRNHNVDVIDPRELENEGRGEPEEEVKEIAIRECEMIKLVKVGKNLTKAVKEELMTLLKEYKDVFAWTHEEIP